MNLKLLLVQGIMSLCFFSNCMAEKISPEQVKKCTKEELINFFPAQIVEKILIENHLSQADAQKVAVLLSHQDLELIRSVEAKVYNLDMGALNDLSSREKAVEIYTETIRDLFSKTVQPYGIVDPKQIQTMLDQIKDERSQLFVGCLLDKKTFDN